MISFLRSRVFSTCLIAVGCLLVGATAPSTAASMPQTPSNTPAPGAKGPGTLEQTLISPSDEVIDALLTGETEAALKAIADLVATSPEHTDAWVVYRAEAWKRKGDLAKAEAELSGFEQRFPASPWAAKARFERAEIARALGEHGEAEVILRQEASTLRGAERRVELGEELVQAADELMERAAEAPTDQARTQHRARARGLLEAAHGLETSDAFKAETALALAHLVLEQGDWPAIVQWTSAAEELMAEDSFAAQEAGVVAARARLASGEAMEARHGLMDAVAALEAQPEGSSRPAWQDLRGNALLFLGEAWRAEGQSLFAIDAWNRLLGLEPTHAASPRVAGLIADVYVELGRTADGIEAWARAESLAAAQSAEAQSAEADATDPTGENSLIGALQHLIEETTGEDRLDAAAYGRRALFRRAQLQAASGRHGDAIASFTEYVASHPGAEDWNVAQEGLLAARFSRAASWLEESTDASLADLEAAEAALLEFADDHPLDHRATDALFQWATIREHYADRFMRKPEADSAQEAGLEARRPFYVTSVERLEELARRTANSDQELSGRALFHAAELVQNRLEDAPRAIAIYQRVVGSHRASAVMRLREMQETHLSVATAGLVRPGEPLVIDVDTRNIEELAVQAVRLDLGQYFQRHQTTTEIERLDLDLIAPDIEWTVPVEDYSGYANLSREVTVPAGSDDEPGVYAVTVVADGKRATTLVIRSELDVIVKRSKAEVFVLVTETDREGRARVAPGTDVTVSYVHAGKRETASLTTDSEGIASLLAPEGGEFGAETRVFVSRAGHVAATELAGEARGSALSLAPRADLQLDRTAYRPGDEVGFRAVIRGVEDGSWKLPTLSAAQRENGQRYTTELIAPNGVAVARVTAEETSAYGSLSGSFELDAAAPSGTWTVQTTAPGNPMASTTFTVGEIEVPRVSLELTTEETVILRGETVQIVATAQTAWGAPLAEVPIVWTDPRGVETRAVTDRDGTATLTHETNQSVAGDRLSFRAQLPEDGGITSSIQVQVAVSALNLEVSVEQPVVLAGETFNALIVASAPDGKTTPTKVRLIGTRRFETRPGRFAEQQVLDETVTTDASGEAVVAVSTEAGGALTLLATAQDRFGREVSATCSLQVAGADDAEPLRVLAKDTSIHAGERGEVRVVDRSKSGGLALMTVEGSKVLERRVVTLAPGLNELSFAADVQHVPDVQVSLSAIRGRRFHERSATFLVTRPLVVSVEAPASLTPEGTAEILVRATDGLGNGVPAELSLALVDRALLAAYPDRSPSLEDLFGIRGRRTPAFVTAASSTFRYEGITEEIDAAILDEGRRAEAQQQLESMRSSVGRVLEDVDDAPMSAAFDAESIAFAAAPASPFDSHNSSSVLGIGGGAGGKRGGRFAGKKRSAPRVPEVGLDQPTAYWNANVVTGSDGVARVSIPMPAHEATWQLDVAGVTVDHRFGSKRAEIVTRSPMVAVIDVPVYLREGDEPQLRGEVTLEEALEADAPVAWELRVAGERSGDDEGPGADGPRQSVQRGTSVLRAGETRLGYTFEKLPPHHRGGWAARGVPRDRPGLGNGVRGAHGPDRSRLCGSPGWLRGDGHGGRQGHVGVGGPSRAARSEGARPDADRRSHGGPVARGCRARTGPVAEQRVRERSADPCRSRPGRARDGESAPGGGDAR